MITDNEQNLSRPRPVQNTISLWLPHKLHEQLKDYCARNCINRSAFVREAIVTLLGHRLAQEPSKRLVDLK